MDEALLTAEEGETLSQTQGGSNTRESRYGTGGLTTSYSSCILTEGVSTDKKPHMIKTQRTLLFCLIIATIFLVVEFVGGYLAHSLAILTDAAHMLSDVSGFAVSYIAAIYVARPFSTNDSRSNSPSNNNNGNHYSYGLHRIEVLGALASVLSIWLVTGILVVEAIERILRPPEFVDGRLMFILAVVGLVVNLLLFWILGGHHHSHSHSHHSHDHHHKDHHHHTAHSSNNINVRGAVIHVVGDIAQSLGVALAGAIIWLKQDNPRFFIVDPICTFLFALIVLYTTVWILRDIGDILMERAPRGIDVSRIAHDLVHAIQGVQSVHDLHVWQLTPGIPLLAAHIEMTSGADATAVLHEIHDYCTGLGIDHSTIQLLANGTACPTCCSSVNGSILSRTIQE